MIEPFPGMPNDIDLARFRCGVPGCETWQDGLVDDLQDSWLASVFAGDDEYFVVCPQHEIDWGEGDPILKEQHARKEEK